MLIIRYLSYTCASEILASVSFCAALNRPFSQADLEAVLEADLEAVLEADLEAVLEAVAGVLPDSYTGVTYNKSHLSK
jgi:hypothetical protein